MRRDEQTAAVNASRGQMQVTNNQTGIQGQRFTRRQAGRLAAATATVAALVAACGGSRPKAAKTAANAQGQPRSGGRLNFAPGYQPETLDPTPKRTVTGELLSITNSRLLAFKTGSDVKYTELVLVPSLAQRWETPDPQTYIFHLHPGVKFANLPPVSGRALTAADVQWSFEYLSRTGALKDLKPAATAAMFQGLDKIETPDEATVSVHFGQPYVPFTKYIASDFSSILAHEIFDQDGDFSKRAVGTGPWQIDSPASQADTRTAYTRNPSYFEQGRPYIDSIYDIYLPDDTTAKAAFQAKQIDILNGISVTADTAAEMVKSIPGVVDYTYLNPSPPYLYMNVSRPPLDDVRIRKAVALSIDRDELIRVFAKGQGEWALANSWPGLFTKEEIKSILRYDPAQAKQLVNEAGYPNGIDIDTDYPGNKYGAVYIQQLQLLQSQFAKGGINLTLKNVDAVAQAQARRAGTFQLSLTTATGVESPLDPDVFLYSTFYPNAVDNYGRINDPELTPLLEAERREMDEAKRTQILRQAVQRINEVPWAAALYSDVRHELWHPYLKNYAPLMAYNNRRSPLWNSWLQR